MYPSSSLCGKLPIGTGQNWGIGAIYDVLNNTNTNFMYIITQIHHFMFLITQLFDVLYIFQILF